MEIRLCPAPSYKVGKDDGCEKRLYDAFLLLLSNYLLCSAKKNDIKFKIAVSAWLPTEITNYEGEEQSFKKFCDHIVTDNANRMNANVQKSKCKTFTCEDK